MIKNGLGNMMKQAQQMQENMQKAQKEVSELRVEGVAGGGMVSVTMSGNHQCHAVNIDASVLEDDKDMLEDLIAAAINDAAQRVETVTREKMAEATQGLQLPEGMSLPV